MIDRIQNRDYDIKRGNNDTDSFSPISSSIQMFSPISVGSIQNGTNPFLPFSSMLTDKFVKSVGFNFVNTNTYMEHDDKFCVSSENGIRSCVPEDYPTALDIWSREYAEMHKRIGLLFEKKEMTEEECKEEYNDFLKNIENSFVMEIDGKIIGYGAIFEDNSGIGAVAIDREYAGRGYGTRLSAFLTNEIIRRGCKTPWLYCESGNDDAMHIYKKIGYYEVSSETVAIKTI